ncbi:hypothetical protein R6Q57_001580 [Mikania cordata]
MDSSSSSNSPPWTVEEEEALAQSYVITSKKHRSLISNPSFFWDLVSYHFRLALERNYDSRSDDELCSKWLDLKRKISMFGDIYDNVYKNRKMVIFIPNGDLILKLTYLYHIATTGDDFKLLATSSGDFI